MFYYIYIAISAWFLADILSGFIHWSIDSYLDGNSRFEFLNKVSRDNDLHHSSPAAFLKYSLMKNIYTTAVATWPISIILFISGAPTILPLVFFFATFSNIIHRWGHLPKKKLNVVIRFLQFTGIFVSGKHHNAHHYQGKLISEKSKSTRCYCAMTIWMNPVLDGLRVFRLMESCLTVLGIRRVNK